MSRPEDSSAAERSFKEPWPEAAERRFKEPWEAQAFALAVRLFEAGCFTWGEWSATLAEVLREEGAADDGSRYYQFWLKALERLVVTKGLLGSDEIAACAAGWARAYRRTPHGKPVELDP